jgi:hypothetical protein
MAYVNPYAAAAKKPKGNAWWDQRLNEGLFGQTYRGPQQTPGQGQQKQNPYAGLIENMLNQTRADNRAESVADAAQRDANIKRILISLGETPDMAGLSGDSQGVLQGILGSGEVGGLASKNTAEGTSMLARLNEANTLATRRIPSAQAGRGMLRSGSTGEALRQQALTHKQKGFDVRQEAASGIESAVGGFAANERARLRAEAQAAQDAAWRNAQLWEDADLGGEIDPQAPDAPHPMDDPYWQNLIAYYEQTPNMGYGTPKKKYQRMGPYGPYGPAVMPRSGMT